MVKLAQSILRILSNPAFPGGETLRSARAARGARIARVLAALSAGSYQAQAPSAAAHQGPEILDLAFYPDAESFVMVTNFGLVFDVDSGEPALFCTAPLGITDSEQPDVAVLRDGRVLIATSGGLRSTVDKGCSLQPVDPYGTTMTSALSQDPVDPDTLYLATFDAEGGALQVSRDAAASWNPLFRGELDLFIQDVRINPTDPRVLYASGQQLMTGKPRTHFIARSLDGGVNWVRSEIELLASETDVALLALDPSDPLGVVARTSAREPRQRLLLSSDGGESWRSVLERAVLHDAAFTAGGATLWVASDEDLARSDDRGAHVESVPGVSWVSALAERGEALWVCGQFADEQNGVAVSRDGGARFETLTGLGEVASAVACPAASPTTVQCEGRVDVLQAQLRSLAPRRPAEDAGVIGSNDAMAGIAERDGGPTDNPERDGGCTVGAAGAFGWTALVPLVALLGRRRRNTR